MLIGGLLNVIVHRPGCVRSMLNCEGSVIQQIADCRADDKSDPHYYARRTVNRAKADLVRTAGGLAEGDLSQNENRLPSLDRRGTRQ